MPQKNLTLSRDIVRSLTRRAVVAAIHTYKDSGKGSFVLPDLPGLGSSWEEQFIPFYQLYDENGKVAGQEMGKLLGSVAKDMGLRSMKENKFGKRDAITRYFFQ